MNIRKNRLRRIQHLLLGLGVAALFLYLALRNSDLMTVKATLLNVDPARIPLLSAVSLFILWLRVWRWLLMFEQHVRPTKHDAFSAFALSSLANSVMPGRLGDVLRAGMVGRHLPTLGVSGAFATVVMEKVFDGLAVLVLLATALWFVPLPEWIMRAGEVAAAVFLAALAMLFALGHSRSMRRDQPPSRPPTSKLQTALRGLFHRFSVGLTILTSAKQFLAVLLVSVAIWCLEVWLVYLCFGVFDIPVPPQAAVVTIALLAVGTMLPAAPGFVGTYQFFVMTALALFYVPASAALALSIFMNVFAVGMTAVAATLALLSRLLPGRSSAAVGD